MKLRTATRLWHQMGKINHLVEEHERVLIDMLEREVALVEVMEAQASLAKNTAQFATDMAGLLVDLMADVKELADFVRHPQIANRIDARADIAGAMLKLQSEADSG